MIKCRKTFFVLFFLLLCHYLAFASQNRFDEIFVDSIPLSHSEDMVIKKDSIKPISFVIPAAMVAYGVWAVNNDYLKKFDRRVKKEIFLDNPHPAIRIDDYLQYTPAAAVFGLNAFGIKGKHKMLDAGAIYLISNVIMSGVVVSIKKTTPVARPDFSGNNSFPSGHTASAFVSAEFLMREYIDVSPWIGIAGYGTAFLTAYLRLYNNKHWFSDVIAGAGIGIISTKLSYLLYEKIQPKLFKSKGKNTIVLPSYQNGSWGVNLVKTLE